MPERAMAGVPGAATTAPRPVPQCPLCGVRPPVLSDRCQSCSGDLRLLVMVMDMADQYFNRAVLAARRKRWEEAAEHLAVTLALRPDDVDALVLLGKVRKQQHKQELALAAWEEALRLAPDREDAAAAIAWVSRPARRSRGKGKQTPG